MNMTPQEIVDYLDHYIIGQQQAKRTIALALRTRYRRLQLDKSMQDEISPKNILMIGSTGVGKTEIARRLAKLLNLPFIKVEASKYTEVGYVGRDVESMVRDLAINAYSIVKQEYTTKKRSQIEAFVIQKIADILLPPLPKLSSDDKKNAYEVTKAQMVEKIKSGEFDDKTIDIELTPQAPDMTDSSLPQDFSKMQESIIQIFAQSPSSKKKESVTVKEAKKLLENEATLTLINKDEITAEALKRCEEGGIIFLDEIDKIAVSSHTKQGSEPSKEGVQRDLLPIVEGSTIQTKIGTINSDHILFIAAGAFHLSKPSDLIPELQGRFPLRVELESLDAEALFKILMSTKNSLLKQYQALLSVESVDLQFDEAAIFAIANYAQKTNESTEDIGARRLHTILENLLEEISFNAGEYQNKTVTIDEALVASKLEHIVDNDDLARYIL